MTSRPKTAKPKGWRKPEAETKNVRKAAEVVKAAGRTGADGKRDTEIIHLNKSEMPVVDRALKRYGGSGKTNPKTGAKEYNMGPGGSMAAAAANGDRSAQRDQASHESGAAGRSDNGSSTERTVPTASKAPAGKQPLGPGGSLAAASANETLGNTGNADNAGGIPGAHADYRPGDVPAVKGADAIGIGARVLGGVTGGVASALSQGLTGKDATEEALGKDHFGTQVGWSGTGPANYGTHGNSDQPASKPAKAPAAPAAAAQSTVSSSVTAGAVGPDGQTITVNPDGTIRTMDTSVAGLRARRRYGAKTAGA